MAKVGANVRAQVGNDAPQKIAGEWDFAASILQCDDALFGRTFFTDTGDLVYLASGSDLLGRGLGRWACEGPVVGFEVDVFQYAPLSTKHTPCEPHRFRGIAPLPSEPDSWSGEWYFCPAESPPKLVGKFTVCAACC
eukprot:gnl/TRDRNA2_/TRDRNA2_133066_c0_seq1.p2 gnl/TRDRNA2_/TRDRNA2_133066_c0~~gnl/TRDRNA2_/TRDRNA2_133066_c0_seq1.p2  ORF type:complete len:137 (+),score=20.09 gnl/TRDRNA2_/TRDRNA2_133066_c0_seq1:28-438(+)